MAVDYDPCDQNVGLTQSGLASMSGSSTSQLYTGFSMRLNPSMLPMQSHKFFTSATDDYSSDARFRDCGRFLLFVTATVTTPLTLGSIFVDYEVAFASPQEPAVPFSNTGTALSTLGGATATDPLGTIDNANVINTAPDDKGSVQQAKPIVKIIDTIVTVVAKIAPFIGLVVKAFLGEHVPLLPGQYLNNEGAMVPISLADVPGNLFVVLHSSQCRSGTVSVAFYGSFLVSVQYVYPTILLATSNNITTKRLMSWPNDFVRTAYPFNGSGNRQNTSVNSLYEFDFTDLTVPDAWMKFVIVESNGNAANWLSIASAQGNSINIYAKPDLS